MAQCTGTPNTSTAAVNLTTVGTTFWLHWLSTVAQLSKSTGSGIGTPTTIGPAATTQGYNNDPGGPISWSDGTPTASGSDQDGEFTGAGVATGSGFQWVLTADTSVRTVNFYLGLFSSSGTFTATLSDGSAGPYTNTFSDPGIGTSGDCNVQVVFQAASAGQTLTVTWVVGTQSLSFGNVTIRGAALSIAAAGQTYLPPARRYFDLSEVGLLVPSRRVLVASSLSAPPPPPSTPRNQGVAVRDQVTVEPLSRYRTKIAHLFGPVFGDLSSSTPPFAAAAAGVEVFSGAEASSTSPFASSEAGAETFTGTESSSVQSFASSEAGTETFTGAESSITQPFASDVAGAEAFSGAEASTTSPFASSEAGGETFAGAEASSTSPFASSLTGGGIFTGTATSTTSPFASAAAGAEIFSGAETSATSPFSSSEAGAEAFTGTVASSEQPFGSSEAGAELFAGAAASSTQPFSSSLSASSHVDGTLATATQPFAAAAAGGEAFSGAAASSQQPFGSSAAGGEAFQGALTTSTSPFGSSAVGAAVTAIVGALASATRSFASAMFSVRVKMIAFVRGGTDARAGKPGGTDVTGNGGTSS